MSLTQNASCASELVAKVLDNLVNGPNWDTVGPRGMATREIRHCWYRLRDPSRCATWLPGRDLNYSFMVAEWLWIFLGRDDVEMIGFYNENIKQFSDDGVNFWGAYGPQWRGQIGGVLERLRSDRDSRQGVIVIARAEYNRPTWKRVGIIETPDRYLSTKDVPCTTTMQYLIRNGVLECGVTMRSSDAWLGLPYDIFNFCMLQRCVAAELNIRPGHLTIHIGSSHVYERDVEKAKHVVDMYKSTLVNPSTVFDQMRMSLPIPHPTWGTSMAEVGAAENSLRIYDSIDTPNADIAMWMSLLGHRKMKIPDLVHDRLRPLVQP